MQKKALLALMLVLTMVLTGCTLVQKDPEVDKAQEVLRLGDKVITKGEVQEQVQSYQDYMSYIYSMYGMSYDASSSEAMAQRTSCRKSPSSRHSAFTASGPFASCRSSDRLRDRNSRGGTWYS